MGNSGLEVERLGVDYTSPQRYSEKTSGFGVGCNLNQKLTVNAVVNKMGKATSVEVIGDSIPERCAETISKYFMRQKYIPAMVNGQAVDAFYSERIFNQMRQH